VWVMTGTALIFLVSFSYVALRRAENILVLRPIGSRVNPSPRNLREV